MTTRSILVQITFWWSVSTMINGGVIVPSGVARPRQRVVVPSSGGVTDNPPAVVPVTSEASVHQLTGINFPPPALLLADPGKNWTMNDFQQPGRPTVYSVTDDTGQDYDADDSATDATVPPPPPEPETTTAIDDVQRFTGDREATTTIIIDVGHDGTTTTPATAIDSAVSEATDIALPAVAANAATPPVAVHTEFPAKAADMPVPEVAAHDAMPAVAADIPVPEVTAHSEVPVVAAHTTVPAIAVHTEFPSVAIDTAVSAVNRPPTDDHSPPPTVHVHMPVKHDWPTRQTIVTYYVHRHRYPVAVIERPYETLSFRPMRIPSSPGIRFPDDYYRRRTEATGHRSTPLPLRHH